MWLQVLMTDRVTVDLTFNDARHVVRCWSPKVGFFFLFLRLASDRRSPT
jgi:hypothetical protein